jgi:phosphomannomutase
MAIRLSFGTAGIRARVGSGDDELSLRSVRVVADALVTYLSEVVPDASERGLCVGFDGRSDSESFAREVCEVALARGFLVRRFTAVVPTPLLAFATKSYGSAAGVMVTASHNPPEDNGLKVFWQGGAQVVAPHDREIAARILRTDPESVPQLSLETPERARVITLGSADEAAYLDAVEALVPNSREGEVPRIAYSALCGVGSAITHRLLARLSVTDVVEVSEQAEPRADFGGLSSPNPEHPVALAKVLALAEREHAELVLCHDPDADRLAVAIRTRTGSLTVLTGDEVGALLGAFMLELDPKPEQALFVSTLVSSALLGRVATAHGAHYERTLTGFKWIITRARALERERALRFVFGYEEAIGYAFGALGDDKDGIAAMRVLLALVRRLNARGATLEDELERLHREHGLYATRQITVRADPAKMKELVASVRSLDARLLMGEGATCTDYLSREERADLMVFAHTDGVRLSVRPSGTEPKLKFYLEARTELGQAEPLSEARARVEARLDTLEMALQTALAAHKH